MSMVFLVFYFFMGLAGVSAIAMLFSKSVFKSALLLLTSLLSIAALYVLSFAEFLAVAQILVYAGGILVIIIFGIMLTTKLSGKPLRVTHSNVLSGLIAGAALFILLVRYLPSAQTVPEHSIAPVEIKTFALALFSEYALPFEIAGLLLLIALIGAAVITANLKSGT